MRLSAPYTRWASKSEKLLPRLEWPKPPPVGSWEEVLAKNHYLAAYTNRPYYPLQYAYEALPERGGSAAEARDRFLLAARLHEASHDLTLNGSRALPDYFFRNWGVAYSQLLATERSDEGVAALKQRAMNAFLKYLAFSTLTEEDRFTVERSLVSLIPPPQQLKQHLAQQEAARQQQQQQQQGQQGQQGQRRLEQQQGQTKPPKPKSDRKKRKSVKAPGA